MDMLYASSQEVITLLRIPGRVSDHGPQMFAMLYLSVLRIYTAGRSTRQGSVDIFKER